MEQLASFTASDAMTTEAFTRRTAFHVNINWEPGASPSTARHVQDQMYVESLEPLNRTEEFPLILIHGDYHSSQIWLTKPDSQPGWASYFLNRGYHVYLVDLPAAARSNFLRENHIKYSKLQSLPAPQVERGLTIPKKYPDRETGNARWPSANRHDKWPGAGTRGDPIFDSYCASLTSMCFSSEERQTLAQNALTSLLQITGKSILIGEGTGATMAWLAADAAPSLVGGVVAIEPPGPPFCKSGPAGPKREYNTFTEYDPKRLRYGLASIPLTYDPPIQAPQNICEDDSEAACLDLALYENADNGKRMILQYSSEGSPRGFSFIEHVTKVRGPTPCVRKLANLQKMRHVLFTAEASSHSAFDISTLHFMKQAGLSVDCGFLKEYHTFGNGHLMFLETNSDEVAALVVRWIHKKVTMKDEMAAVLSSEVTPAAPVSGSSHTMVDLEAQPDASLQHVVNTTSPASSKVIDLTAESEPNPSPNYLDSEPMDICQSEDTPVMTVSTTVPPVIQPLPTPPTDYHFTVPTLPENPEDVTLPEVPIQNDEYLTPSPSMATEYFTPLPYVPAAPVQEPRKRELNFEYTPWRLEQRRRKENWRPKRGNTNRYDSTPNTSHGYVRSVHFPSPQQWQPPPPPLPPLMNQGSHSFGQGNGYGWPPHHGQPPYPMDHAPRRMPDTEPYGSLPMNRVEQGAGSNFYAPHGTGNNQQYNGLPMLPSLNPSHQKAEPSGAMGYPPAQWRG